MFVIPLRQLLCCDQFVLQVAANVEPRRQFIKVFRKTYSNPARTLEERQRSVSERSLSWVEDQPQQETVRGFEPRATVLQAVCSPRSTPLCKCSQLCSRVCPQACFNLICSFSYGPVGKPPVQTLAASVLTCGRGGAEGMGFEPTFPFGHTH